MKYLVIGDKMWSVPGGYLSGYVFQGEKIYTLFFIRKLVEFLVLDFLKIFGKF